MSEREIQKTIKANRKYWKAFIPNIMWNDLWEADLIEITSGYNVIEYEIKRSVHDFMADFRKEEKHKLLNHGYNLELIPNAFNYVCEEGIIKPKDVPNYAGLIYIIKSSNGLQKRLKTVKKTPILHNEKVSFDKWRQIAIRLANKLPI